MEDAIGGTAVDAEVGPASQNSQAAPRQLSCMHSRMARGEITLDFRRPGQERSSYAAPISVLVCEACGNVKLEAEMHKFLCDWLKER